MLENFDRINAAAAFFAMFVLAGILTAPTQSYRVMTEIYCSCDVNEGDVPCNDVTQIDYIFYTGLVNIYREHNMKEIVECRNGNRSGTHNRMESQQYGVEFLSTRAA